MDDFGRMNVFESSEKLVEKEFIVLFCERLFALDDGSEVGIHHLRDHVHILELLSGFGEDDGFDVDDILVFEQLQQSQFSESALSENLMLESLVDFLNSNQIFPLGFALIVLRGDHNSIGTLSD